MAWILKFFPGLQHFIDGDSLSFILYAVDGMEISVEKIKSMGWSTNSGEGAIQYETVSIDSRTVDAETIFFAYDGLKNPGKSFIVEAAQKGAPAVFVDAKYMHEITENLSQSARKVRLFFSPDFPSQAGLMISALYDNPSLKMKCIGVTGTNGKTTTAWAIYSILKKLQKKPSYIGTIGIELPGASLTAKLTTPPVDELQKYLYQAASQGGDYAIMETSSHGLKQGRLFGVNFCMGLFTNLTEDHRDYHHSVEDYLNSKKILFERVMKFFRDNPDKPCGAIINVDDPYGREIYDWIKTCDKNFPVTSFGKNGDFRICSIKPSWNGYAAQIEFEEKKFNLQTRFIGNFNIYNLGMAFAALLQLGFLTEDILPLFDELAVVPGRMEVHQKSNGALVVIDYAHTPDALKKALETLGELKPEKIHVLFGCGGDRDQAKRSEMGKIAEQWADQVILTNDNPRSEDPEKIMQQIESGMKKKNHLVIYDRKEAIRKSLQKIDSGSVLLVAGKGHEDYQILPGGRIHFSDREVIQEALRE